MDWRNVLIIVGKHDTEMARKSKLESEKNYSMLKDRQRVTSEELAQTKVRLEKAQREVSSLDQRLGRALTENTALRKKVGMQVSDSCYNSNLIETILI